MSSSLKYTLLDSQLNQNPIILHKNERKPMLQTRKVNSGKSMLTLKSEQLTELFLVPFSVVVENRNDDRQEQPLKCVCSGHCQNGCTSQTSGGDIEMVCLDNNHHSQQQDAPENNVNSNQNEQAAYQKLKLNQDRLRLQNQQMKNLQKLGDFHGLANMLRVDTRTGLSNYNQSDLGHRMKQYGSNRVTMGREVSFRGILKEHFFKLKMVMILLIGALLIAIRCYSLFIKGSSRSSIFRDVSLEIGTMVMVFATFIAKSLKRYFVDKEFNNLVCVNSEYRAKVLRNSQVQYIKSTQLVVGDIMMVEAGDIINVDGILIETNDLKVNESALISGRENVPKQAPDRGSFYIDCFLYSGTQIMAGQGEMIVCCVGNNTLLDRVQKTNQKSIYRNPLGDQLSLVQEKIGKTSTNSSTLITLFIICEYFWDAHNRHLLFSIQSLCDVLQLVQMILALSFLLMPEGLTEALDTYLSYSVKQLEPLDVIIKDLSALEWMGFVDSIVTDKTGCVTENNNRVEKVYTHEEQTYEELIRKKATVGHNKRIETLLFENICINSAAVLQKDALEDEVANKTVESALLEFAFKLGFDYERYRIQSKVKKTFNFNTKHKRMITLFQKNQSILRVYFKGQPDVILDKCTKFINSEGRPQEILPPTKKIIQDRVALYGAKESLKLIFFAYKDLDFDPTQIYSEELLNQELIFVGIVCIKDPFRLDMPESLRLCHEANITVRALTGDNKESAVSTAMVIGLLPENFDYHTSNMAILDGDQFKKIIDCIESFQSRTGGGQTIQKLRGIDQFQKHIKELRMISKGRSFEKDALVTGLIQLKYVVAVTGDDTEDIKIIKKAQVSIGLGQSGNEVVKQAASIILKKDSFTSIIPAILWGRNIYEFVRKYFQLILSQSQIIIVLLLLNVVVWERHLFNAAQFLLLNILVDEFAAHALAREAPSECLLEQPPIRRKEYIIKPIMWRNILCETVFEITILSMLLFGDLSILFDVQQAIFNINHDSLHKLLKANNGVDEIDDVLNEKDTIRFRYSLCYNCLVFMQLFNILSCSSLHATKIHIVKDFKRKFYLTSQVFIILGLYLALMEYFPHYFDCVSHGFPEHFLCFTIAIVKLMFNYFVRCIKHQGFARLKFVKYTFDFE